MVAPRGIRPPQSRMCSYAPVSLDIYMQGINGLSYKMIILMNELIKRIISNMYGRVFYTATTETFSLIVE